METHLPSVSDGITIDGSLHHMLLGLVGHLDLQSHVLSKLELLLHDAEGHVVTLFQQLIVAVVEGTALQSAALTMFVLQAGRETEMKREREVNGVRVDPQHQ